MNRRRFLVRATAAAASPLAFPAVVSCASPNSKLQVASVGVARMGGNTMKSVASHPKVEITALCDVDAGHLAQGARQFSKASQHRDWRELLASHASKFDAITIGTPDHMHAPITVLSLRAGKHVYLQKPMAPTVHECRIIAAEAAKAGVITQMGNQGRSSIESRMMVELLRTKAAGPIKEILFWENKPLNWWPANTNLRKAASPIPDGLDWDAWVGIRQPHDYHADTYHPEHWRAWRDFGVGELGDMGCHHFDSTVDGLKLPPPSRVRQTITGEGGEGLWARNRRVEFEFTGLGDNDLVDGDTLRLVWYDGELLPDTSKIPMPAGFTKFPRAGGLWTGTTGSIFKPYTVRPYVLPEASFPAEKYPRTFSRQDHYHDWVDAVIDNRKACSDFAHAANLTEVVLVGTLAESAPGQWVDWDRATGQTNHSAINALLQPVYRDGWRVEGLG